MSEALSFGPWLKQRRRVLALTQEDLARRAFCSEITIRRVEAGNRLPSQELAQLLATALQVPVNDQAAFITFARSSSSTSALTAQNNDTPIAVTIPQPANFVPTQPSSTTPTQLLLAEKSTLPPAQSRRKARLPAQLTALVGREWEVLFGKELVCRPNVRLITLTGAPGTGKTRLSLAIAEAAQDAFADGAYFVPLAPISDPTLVSAALAQALGVRLANHQSHFDSLQTFLEEKEALLVLDNFEQVLAAANDLVRLLESAPAVKMLVTSRSLLKVYGEHEFPVPPLTLPSDKQLPALDELRHYSSVALFVQRAQAVHAGFRLNSENAATIVHICTRLDGLPLAIEMAAARSKVYAPTVLLAQLQQQLVPLSSSLRNLSPRQQTLHNAIEWSYHLLKPAEQRLFTLLGIFVGGCTSEAISAIGESRALFPAGVAEVVLADQLQSLLEHSLLKYFVNEDGGIRYVMLETLRQYARERAESHSQWQPLQRAHADYFGRLVAGVPSNSDSVGQRLWFNPLEQEHDNLRAALAWCHEQDVLLGLGIATALSDFWFSRGYRSEGSDHLVRLLAHPMAQQAGAVRARALCAAGFLVEVQGNHALAQTYLEESVTLCQQIGDRECLAKTLHSLGVVAFYQNDYASAKAYYQQALALQRELGKGSAEAATLRNLGLIAKDQGKFDEATRYFAEGLAVAQALNDHSNIARFHYSLSNVAFWQGDYDRAIELSQQCLSLFQQLGDKPSAGYALDVLGASHHKQGELRQAIACFEQCLALFQEVDDKVGIMIALDGLAALAAEQGNSTEAANRRRQSLTLAWQAKEKRRMAFSLEGLAAVSAQAERAIKLYAAATALRTAIGAPLAPIDRQIVEAHLVQLRADLDEERYTWLWTEGGSLSPDRVVAFALESQVT